MFGKVHREAQRWNGFDFLIFSLLKKNPKFAFAIVLVTPLKQPHAVEVAIYFPGRDFFYSLHSLFTADAMLLVKVNHVCPNPLISSPAFVFCFRESPPPDKAPKPSKGTAADGLWSPSRASSTGHSPACDEGGRPNQCSNRIIPHIVAWHLKTHP